MKVKSEIVVPSVLTQTTFVAISFHTISIKNIFTLKYFESDQAVKREQIHWFCFEDPKIALQL